MTPSTRGKLWLCIAPLAVIAVVAWYLSRPSHSAPLAIPAAPSTQPRSPSQPFAGGASSAHVPSTPHPQVDPERPALQPLAPAPSLAAIHSPIADNLNATASTGAQDLAVVYQLLDRYREIYGAFPTGEDNATIVNALTGNNPRRLAFLDRTHPAISARGELIDRWQTPLFFHLESRDAVEIRSAGPDREMYSSDDLRKQSPALQATVPPPRQGAVSEP